MYEIQGEHTPGHVKRVVLNEIIKDFNVTFEPKSCFSLFHTLFCKCHIFRLFLTLLSGIIMIFLVMDPAIMISRNCINHLHDLVR